MCVRRDGLVRESQVQHVQNNKARIRNTPVNVKPGRKLQHTVFCAQAGER